MLAKSAATLIIRDTGVETPLISDALIYDVEEAKEVFDARLTKQVNASNPAYVSLMKKLGLWLLKPDVRFDRERTEERLLAARTRVEKVFFQIKRGEVLVRAGERITPAHLVKLESLSEARSRTSLARSAIGYFILVLLTLSLLFTFARRGWSKFRPGVSELLLISVALVVTVGLERVGVVVGEALSLVITDVDPEAFSLFAPIAVGAIIIQAVLGTTYVTFFILAYATVFSLLQQDFSAKVAIFVFGSLVGSLAIKGASRRSAFLITGVRIAITNVILCLTYSILFPQMGVSSSIATIVASAVGGLISGVFALGVLPIIEYFGGYVTAIKLLELASLERPLLRELSMQAPGTWSHSMVMGQLCESAADSIGAAALLTRVGAYYHDIGKAKKPLYFAENQSGRENRHDKLAPSMSALIIRSHVKDGIEMAKAHRLPSALIDFIPQHHGTALIEFFYDKATKEASTGEIIDENLFRYPGPKPQTKEAGIIMLADNVEAISRVMSDPSPAKIQGMIQKVINRVFASGQLDESELTLKDLHHIAKSFSRVLTGIVHRRVEYPESSDKNSNEKNSNDKKESEAIVFRSTTGGSAANNADLLPDSTKHNQTKTEKSEKSAVDSNASSESKETLRRLGI